MRARALGLSEAEVARRVGLGATRGANYVTRTREPEFATLLRICQLLETTPNDLLGVREEHASVPSPAEMQNRIRSAVEAMDPHTFLVATEVVEPSRGVFREG